MKVSVPHFGWQRLERASFGLIYGAIMVLSILMALEFQPNAPFRPAAILFGSVLAMTLARTLAALFSHGVETGERIMNIAAVRAAWQGSHHILVAAYLPTALFMAAGLGWLVAQTALSLSQLYCVLTLAILGARAGWVIRGGLWHSVLGAASAGGLGSLLAAMRHVLS
jgi:hypothetical protein